MVSTGSSKIVNWQIVAKRKAMRCGTAATKLLDAIANGKTNTCGVVLSKVGLNGFTVLLAKELQSTNILVNTYSPGWMQTDMGGSDAPFTADEGAETAIYLATPPSMAHKVNSLPKCGSLADRSRSYSKNASLLLLAIVSVNRLR